MDLLVVSDTLEIEVRQFWLAIFLGLFLYLVTNCVVLGFAIFLFAVGLFEDEDEEELELREYLEYDDEEAFINDTFCEFNLDYFFNLIEDNAKKGSINRRFLNNDLMFNAAKDLELLLVKNFNNNLEIDVNNFLYLYLLFTSSATSILKAKNFSLNFEETADEAAPSNKFFNRIFDRNVHRFFDIRLNNSYKSLKYNLDFEFELKFLQFYELKQKFFSDA
jgi:hypothetical protein